MDILTEKEHVRVDRMLGHGGLFKVKDAAQGIMAVALNIPVAVMETAGEGGAWGMAILAAYMLQKEDDEPLDRYLDEKVFARYATESMDPSPEDVRGFETYMERYVKGLAVERAATEI
jgi:sugar (pentulose or hexulose) kinase